jgi:hypothetical protein
MNMLQSFDVMKTNIEKHLSSFTLSVICTMANLVNFTYSGKLWINIQDIITRCHIFIKRLVSKGEAMHSVAFNLIINLNMPYWLSRSLVLKTSNTKVSTPSNNWVLPK